MMQLSFVQKILAHWRLEKRKDPLFATLVPKWALKFYSPKAQAQDTAMLVVQSTT